MRRPHGEHNETTVTNQSRGFLIDGSRSKIGGRVLRISNMGDETEATMNQLLTALDKAMGQL